MIRLIDFFKVFGFLGICFLFLVFSTNNVLAQSCNKTTLSGNGSGITCTYLNPTSGCSASCASGWSTSCSNGYSDSGSARCYIKDPNCNNTATCYKCETGQKYYYCRTSDHSCNLTNNSYTSYSACQSNLSTYMSGQTDGYCYSDGSSCMTNCKGSGPTPTSAKCTSSSQCNDYDSCTTDSCNSSSGTCSHSDNGTCGEPDPECQTPYCLDSGYTWTVNCGLGDCWEMNHWLDAVYYVCCKPQWPYLCASSGTYQGTGCYEEEMCNYCGGACIDDPCPSYCHTNVVTVRGGEDGDGWCTYKGCPANQRSGGCGWYNGRVLATEPTVSSLLCYSGTPSAVTNDGTHWNWTCNGSATDGCDTPGTTATCQAISNVPPVITGLIIKSNTGATVPPESSNRNQICQPAFNGSRTVTFEVSATDADGVADITNVTLTWLSKTIPRTGAIGATTVFSTTFDGTWNTNYVYSLDVRVTDSQNHTVSSSPRNFKIWNCNVGVSGAIYDSTDDGGPTCPTIGFTKLAQKDSLNFKSLAFVGGGVGVSMTVNADGVSYTAGPNYLTWGVNGYVPTFNPDISLTSRALKSKPTTAASWDCNYYLDTTKTDPYSSNPTITADFSGIVIQDPWWQANNGGAISNTEVIGRVPVTCSGGTCKISRSALVAAPLVSNNTNKSLTDAQSWYYTGSGAKLAEVNTNYGFFYDKYFVKKGQGTTLASGDKNMSDITATSGIFFVNGNLNIDTNKVTNSFFMVIVNGNITVDQSVTQIDGIYVANNITAAGTNDSQLVFNGSLFASGTVNFSRDRISRVANNTSPTVLVNYNPKLLFDLPGDLAKILVNWQWGN